jgi:hypothetical protein
MDGQAREQTRKAGLRMKEALVNGCSKPWPWKLKPTKGGAPQLKSTKN